MEHKEVFIEIRNYLAGRFVGGTRDRALLEELIKCIFCKLYIDHNGILALDDAIELAKVYRDTFGIIKQQNKGIFADNEEILIDPESILFVHNKLTQIDFGNSLRDEFGDMYEIFIGTGVREEEGQFFTPQNGIELLVSIIDPKENETVLDPANGAGGFLSYVMRYLSKKGIKSNSITDKLYGIEKDSYLAWLGKIRISLLTLNGSNIVCGDSLSWIDEKSKEIKLNIKGFDIILTNPPFGKKIVAVSKDVQKTYDLGYSWKYDIDKKKYIKTDKMPRNVPPQVLFVEKCVKLLNKGGRMGIVLPESLLTSSSYSFVVQYLRDNGAIQAVIGMPEDFFKTTGKGGTHTKACLLIFKKNHSQNDMFMAEARWCGHDSRGKKIDKDDLPLILENFRLYRTKSNFTPSSLGYFLNISNIKDNILSPRYYNPEIRNKLLELSNTHETILLGDLVEKGFLEIKTGNEVGKMAYGTGNIPFVRTSDISNWEIKLDPKHGINEEIFNSISKKQDVRENDILMVKDGTYLIGTTAIITKYDTKIAFQSHLYKIRVLNKKIIDPFLLLAVLSSQHVQEQIKSKRFTQDIIDSLGKRIYELELPIPKDNNVKTKISNMVEKAINERIEARELSRKAKEYVIDVENITNYS